MQSERITVAVAILAVLLLYPPAPADGRFSDRPLTAFPSPAEHRDLSKQSTVEPPGNQPVLIVAGWGARPDDIYYWPLYQYLERAGYKSDDVYTVAFADYSYQAVDSPRANADTLARKVQSIREKENRPVDIIAHSMGGLAARWFVEKQGGDRFVDDLITMGTPHRGNNVAYLFYFTDGAQAMVPGSPFLRELDPLSFSDRVEYLNLWSMMDFFYVNRWNAKLPERVVRRHDNVSQMRYSFLPHLLMPLVTFDEYVESLD